MINGKDISTVLNELQMPCAKTQKKDKYAYYPVERYEERLDSVVGKSHYKVSYTEPQFFTLPTQQVLLMVRCEMFLIDDAGNEAYQVEGIGSHELTYSEKNSSYVNLNNCGYCLQVSAFKSACKNLDMFGMHANKGSENRTEQPAGQNQEHASNDAPSTQSTDAFVTAGRFEVIRTDSRTSKPIYKVSANRVVGNRMQEKVSEILFYPNQYKKYADKVNSYVALCNDGGQHKLKINYSVSTYYDTDTEQLIFKGFVS